MIIVCSLSDLDNVCMSVKPSHVISVIDPGFEPKTPKGVSNHLKLGFDDIIEIKTTNLIHRKDNIISQDTSIHQVLPNEKHIIKIVNFINTWNDSKPIVIHCWCGVSRSMATATYMLCNEDSSNIDRNIKYIRSIAPHANPNKLMISLFENKLNLNSKISDSYIKYPYTAKYDCSVNFAPITIFNIEEMKNFK